MYRNFILQNFPRLLTQIDKDRDSQYYGSFDRNFWHYKMRDFPSAILQQGGLSLALMYKYDFQGNRYHKKEYLKEWAKASVDFWSSIQLPDGSFNEYYPNEHGYPPTAFGLYSTASICLELDIRLPRVLKAAKNAADYLIKISEPQASNQQIAGITGLLKTARLLNDNALFKKAEEMLDRFLKTMSPEGWFIEYGGFDLGYLSITCDQLVEAYLISGNREILLILEKILDFIQYFVTPASTIGGGYNSRNTEYYLLYHLEFLRNKIPLAGKIADRLGKNIDNDLYYQKSFDDRYICHYVLYSFIKAQLEYEKRDPLLSLSKSDLDGKQSRYFDVSGVFVDQNDGIHVVINLRKGGIVKVTDERGEIFNDFGYRVRGKKGEIGVTNWLNPNYKIKKEGNNFLVEGKFTTIKLYKINPLRHFLIRILSFFLKRKLIEFLKNKMIFINRESQCQFRRSINVEEGRIVINDRIISRKLMDKVYSSDKFSMRHVPSSKSFHEGDLIPIVPVCESQVKEFEIEKAFFFKSKEIIVKKR